jgi:hypothetical protein
MGGGRGAGSSLAGATSDLDSHVSRPSHVALGRWLSRPAYPSAQILSAVERCRMTHDFPLVFFVRESIADLDLHRQDGDCRRHSE